MSLHVGVGGTGHVIVLFSKFMSLCNCLLQQHGPLGTVVKVIYSNDNFWHVFRSKTVVVLDLVFGYFSTS